VALKKSQKWAAAALAAGQGKALEVLRARQLIALEHVLKRLKETLMAAFDAAANTLRTTQAVAAELLLQAQRETAAIPLKATILVTSSRHEHGDFTDVG
jgi:hypothetical protein